ncbi:MAG: 50S ribosomal protein L22 [Acidobacteriota bacterium]
MAENKSISFAIGRFHRISAQKCRLVIDEIRGKNVGEALTILSFSKKRKASKMIEKVLKSAIANAQNKFPSVNVDNLYIQKCYVNDGPSLKRIRPAPMGRAYRILRRFSHICIHLNERT